MLTIKSELKGSRVDVSIEGNTYGDRLNVNRDNILAENYWADSEVNEADLDELEDDVFWEITNEEGEWYEMFTSLAEEDGLNEVCVVGKY